MSSLSPPNRGEFCELPALRILDPEEVGERACDRQAWGDLWRAIAREAEADQLTDPRGDDEKATAQDSAAA